MEKREDYIRHKNNEEAKALEKLKAPERTKERKSPERAAGKSGGGVLRGNWIVKNLLLGAVVVVAMMFIATFTLSLITEHGKKITVPDFTGMPLGEATRIAANTSIRAEVVDSIYVKRLARGSVVRQEPRPGAFVKKGRRIQLTINALSPKMIPMPSLVGYSLRSARAEIRTRGFRTGRLIYVQDMATNNVLRQMYRSKDVPAGKMLPSESEIDLVLGLNPVENLTQAPDVKGLTLANAESAVLDNSLNIGRRIYDRSVISYQDSLDAVVYSQDPDPVEGSVLMGRSVNLYLTVDLKKVPAKTE